MTELLDPGPQNLDAEESVLGAMLLSPRAIDSVRPLLEPRDFYRESHGRIFRAIVDLDAAGTPADPISVSAELERLGLLSDTLTRDRVHELAGIVPATSNAAHHAQLVLSASRRRTELAVGKALQAASANGGLEGNDDLRIRVREILEQPSGAAGAFTLDPQTASDLCAQPDADRTDELLGGLVVKRYRTLIGGHTGEGKTTTALAMVRAIVDGDEFLDYQGTGSARALVLDAEQGEKSLKRRLREAHLDASDQVDVIRVPDGLALNADPRHIAELERVLTAGNYDVVIADPLYKLHTGDSNAEREAVDLMRRFDAWRDQLGFALLLPLHCRKPIPGMKFSIHDLFGSSAYVRGAEVVLGLQRMRDGYSRLHYLKDRDGDLPIGATWGLLFDREQGFRRDPDDGKQKQTTADHVRELLELTPWMTKEQLKEATGKELRTVETALRDIGAISERPGGSNAPKIYALADAIDSQSSRSQLAMGDET